MKGGSGSNRCAELVSEVLHVRRANRPGVQAGRQAQAVEHSTWAPTHFATLSFPNVARPSTFAAPNALILTLACPWIWLREARCSASTSRRSPSTASAARRACSSACFCTILASRRLHEAGQFEGSGRSGGGSGVESAAEFLGSQPGRGTAQRRVSCTCMHACISAAPT